MTYQDTVPLFIKAYTAGKIHSLKTGSCGDALVTYACSDCPTSDACDFVSTSFGNFNNTYHTDVLPLYTKLDIDTSASPEQLRTDHPELFI